MEPGTGWVSPLALAVDRDERLIEGKPAGLTRLARAGSRMAAGLVICRYRKDRVP